MIYMQQALEEEKSASSAFVARMKSACAEISTLLVRPPAMQAAQDLMVASSAMMCSVLRIARAGLCRGKKS